MPEEMSLGCSVEADGGASAHGVPVEAMPRACRTKGSVIPLVRGPGQAIQASPPGASVQPKSRPGHTPDSLPLSRSGNFPRLPPRWTLPGDPQVPLPSGLSWPQAPDPLTPGKAAFPAS